MADNCDNKFTKPTLNSKEITHEPSQTFSRGHALPNMTICR